MMLFPTFRACRVLATVVAVTACGCSRAPSTGNPPGLNATEPKATQLSLPAFDETRGYFHRPSGVGFVYPEGWQLGPAKQQGQGAVTALDLDKDAPVIHVSVFWSLADTPIDAGTVGRVEFEGLRGLYKDKVSIPKSVMAGAKAGFKLSIQGAPVGVADPEAVGVVYVFAIMRGQQWWKIKLRGTARRDEDLAQVEQLLAQFRW